MDKKGNKPDFGKKKGENINIFPFWLRFFEN